MEPIEEETLIQNCDAVLWGSREVEENIVTIMHFFKAKTDTVVPTDLGHKYNILVFRTHDDVDIFTAIIGDPKGYVERMGKLGYNGILFKKNSKASKEFKELVLDLIHKWGFQPKEAKRLFKNTVN